MNGKLVESHVEQAAIEWLKELEYDFLSGYEIDRPLKEVVLEDRLHAFLENKYPDLPESVYKEAVSRFKHNEGQELDYRNRDFHIKLSKGIDVSWKDKSGVEHSEHVYAVDYEQPENNDFLAVNQFEIIGKERRRPDLIIFVNGLPVVLFELKNMFEQSATVEDAFNQIQHYKLDIPQAFEYNAVTVISDGAESLSGTHSSDMEWFTPWKSIDGRTIAEEGFELHSLIKGMFAKDRILDYIRYFLFHEDHNGRLIKKGAKYHQFFGIRFAVEATAKAIKPIGDGRIGVIWHTQGSGKSISMAIYTAILQQMKELENPTIVIQVDRRDLDSQLYDNFVLAQDLVGRVEHAESTSRLRELLESEAGGVIFTTIEKFRLTETEDGKELAHPVLSARKNVIVIADEAHRTQYGLLDGYAANLRKALPNASFIGFTGTPVDSKDADTKEVFGETIHVYDIKQAVEDKATVGIIYEPRLAKLHLVNENIDEEAEEIAKDAPANEANRLKWAAVEDAAGSEDRVGKVSEDILSHFLARTETLPGKAMIVCMSRKNCVKMHDALTKLEGCPEIAVIMTGNIAKDPKEWNPHIHTKDNHEALKKRFKDPYDPLKIVIVRDMWLTGFDAPCVHSMYVDKIMKGHNLMQAIARVNRVFKDKPSGVIVDYIGIGDHLKSAAKKYTGGGGKGKPSLDMDEVFAYCREQLELTKSFLPEGIDYSRWKALSAGDKFLLIGSAVNHIVRDDETADAFMLEEKKLCGLVSIAKSHKDIDEIALDVIFLQHVGQSVKKLKKPVFNTKKAHKEIKELITRSIDSEEIVDVYKMAGIEKPDISILNERFLLGAKEEKEGANIKIELLRQILNNEIKLRKRTNIKKYTSLKKELEAVIKKYHKNAADSYVTILELLKKAEEMRDEDRRKKEFGLSDEELAFYDILHHKESAIKDIALIKDIVQRIVGQIKNNLELDWTRKPEAKAAIRLAVKKELRKNVKLSELNAILAEIMEQAEGRYQDYPLVG